MRFYFRSLLDEWIAMRDAGSCLRHESACENEWQAVGGSFAGFSLPLCME